MTRTPQEAGRDLVTLDAAIRSCETVVSIQELQDRGVSHFRMISRKALLRQVLDVVAVFVDQQRSLVEAELAVIVERREEEARDVASRRVLMSIVDLADLVDSIMETLPDDALKVPFKSLNSRLARMFRTYGFRRIETVGCRFNVDHHEVVDSVPDDAAEGTIIREISRGYFNGECTLRVARVVISDGRPESQNST